MKALLVWSVAAWVISVTSDRPCAVYCVYLSSATGDLEFQTGCDCTYEAFQDSPDEDGVYYEPVVPLPGRIENQPFYILNPIIEESQTNSPVNEPVVPENIPSYSNSHTHDTDIEFNVDNTHSTHNRQVKDIQSNIQRSSSPSYLDINVESGEDERSASASSFTTEELKLTEKSLLDCADLYAVLHSRKSTNVHAINNIRPKQNNQYSHLSNAELIKLIQKKCSYITYIVEKSLNEIKKARPKLTHVIFKIDDEDKQNNEGLRTNDIHKPNKHKICISTTEKSVQSTVQKEDNDNGIKEYPNNPEQTIIIYTDSDENVPDNLSTISSEVLSTGSASTSVENIHSSADIYTKIDVPAAVTKKNIKQRENNTPVNTENEYLLHNEAVALDSTTMTKASTSSTPILVSTSSLEQEVSENQSTDKVFRATNDGVFVNRSSYKEGEVPVAKIITQEFSNNTVKSYINGTEDIPNGDFDDEIKYTEDGNENGNSSTISTYYQYTGTTSTALESSTSNIEDNEIEVPEISGNLYFVFNDHLIPARFVQNLNGSLNLGIDAVSLCNTFTQNGEYNSTLLKILCHCCTSGNCTQKDSN